MFEAIKEDLRLTLEEERLDEIKLEEREETE
ncbi:hypothetical protein LCGC14_2212510 [marine sediment metagenome]|uniref:Uncharacterized protein n=1 Tax=marine sediment metagenome TaxID=412755 RepID=A0A0F9E0T8_9ZZZZ